jgi:hypothetical protein
MEMSRLRVELALVKIERGGTGVWPISVQCRVLRVSVAGYHEHFDLARLRHSATFFPTRDPPSTVSLRSR